MQPGYSSSGRVGMGPSYGQPVGGMPPHGMPPHGFPPHGAPGFPPHGPPGFPPEGDGQGVGAKKDPVGPLSFRHFALGALAIFFYVGIEVGIPNTANLFMSEDPDVGPALAGGIIGAYWFLMMVGRFIGASIGSKVSSKKMLTVVSLAAICLVLGVMFIPEPVDVFIQLRLTGIDGNVPVAMLCMLLCGLCTSVMWGCIFNLSVEGLGKYTPLASGIFMTLVCGGGILPFIQDIVADGIGAQGSYVVVLCGLIYILYYALRGSKNVNTDIKTD